MLKLDSEASRHTYLRVLDEAAKSAEAIGLNRKALEYYNTAYKIKEAILSRSRIF